ncbi:ATP-binding protein [Streptomyces cavernicola]|uniref:ATP-binding protein n=1 Tax=Streptomyces cavernicola TaxID=3043613 RepID=A0ABT6SHI3_9ACTN|nr:ATP-binding protein [Streptomyces sp. B-S-A6]MDI3407658.1 ATP-binding protein [Streptomyces sp. B-S-A6]
MTPAAVTTVAAELMQQTARGFRVAFTPDKTRVGRMRRITTAHLRLWQVYGQTADDIVLTVSELVTNSIQHGDGDVGLKVLYTDNELRVEVTDCNPEPAQHKPADDEAVSGRGLFLVAALAHDWGVSDDGTTTWATFRVPAGRLPAIPPPPSADRVGDVPVLTSDQYLESGSPPRS